MKKLKSWKSFDFGDVKETPKQSPQKSYENTIVQKENKPVFLLDGKDSKRPTFNFHKTIEPRKKSDLAVHPKKIQEVEGWIQFCTECRQQDRKNTSFLLLTGPTGSGKTATVNVVCKSLGITVTEWINPMDTDFENNFSGISQISKFLDFLTDAKYSSLFDIGNNKKVILIEDFPNTFLRNPDQFFEVLEECYYRTRHPVIFVCTDASSSDINIARILFPEEIQLKYAITHFSFNTCAPTILKNALKRAQLLVKDHPDALRPVGNSTIDAIVAASMGDIRSAMNQFHLASLLDTEEISLQPRKKEKGAKRKRNDQSSSELPTMSRDETLGLFHGLGRVLNPKRIETGTTWRLQCDVEKLIDEFSIQPNNFTAFLFENYPKYFGDTYDLQKAAEYLSISVRFLENWESHDTVIFALWVSVLGLMIANEHRVSKWNQIRGPRKITKSTGTSKDTGLTSTDYCYWDIITKSEKYHRFK